MGYAPKGRILIKRLGIDAQTVFGLSPVEHIALAAGLGCGHISIAPGQAPWKLADIGEWSLRDDPQLRRDVVTAASEHGIEFSLGEGFAIRPGTTAKDFAGDLDLMAELGVTNVGTVGIDTDVSRTMEQLGTLSELTAERGLSLLLEFAPPHAFPGLDQAVAALRLLKRPNIKLNLDVMHFFRCGNDVSQIAALPVEMIGRAQLCDAKLLDQGKPYMQEACFERLLPGEGELPLEDFVAALPPGLPIGIETPNQAASRDRAGLMKYVRRAVDSSARFLPSR